MATPLGPRSKDPSLLSVLLARRRALEDCVPHLRELLSSSLYRRFRTTGKSAPPYHHHGSVYNIQFSPTDSIMLTACSNKAIVGYDPRIPPHKPVRSVHNAHLDGTNCITFISDTSFASCSDDKTIRLWDLRSLASSTCVLTGHTNWVKNIEYDPKTDKLFSVAFQDGVREWSLGQLKSEGHEDSDNYVFKLSDPVRMRIAPDGSRMFVSLRQNTCFVIDRFDGNTISQRRKEVEALVSHNNSSGGSSSDNGGYGGDGTLKPDLLTRVCSLKTNRPRVLAMSGLRNSHRSFRTVMSATFHPCGELMALRHVDVKNQRLDQELSTLYDLRVSDSDFQPCSPIDKSAKNYLKYIDEYSPDPSLDYIKECCFSPDGRVLASPHEYGARLLAVDTRCTPPDLYFDRRYFCGGRGGGDMAPYDCYDLEVACSVTGHGEPVLACGFARHDMILGTGCMDGQVLFHKPQL